MGAFRQWLGEQKQPTLEKDSQGGIVPQNLKVAAKVDLITLPQEVSGTNCFNCKYIEKHDDVGWCKHEHIQQWVNKRNCCAYWDHEKVKRPFKKID